MPLPSLTFFLFLILLFLIFLLSPKKARWLVLLLGSLVFYATQGPIYLLLVLVYCIIATYKFGLWLGQTTSENKKNQLLFSGIGLLILPLFILRYLPVVLQGISPEIGKTQVIWATIGVSFYSFQGISYLIDIYRGILLPENNIGYFALYLSFFSKLIQGPIERGNDLLPQINQIGRLSYKNLMIGILQIAWGVILKILVADRLALFVDPVYNNVRMYSGLPLIVSTYFFAFQIYFDFLGYTQIALGVARLFNINLTNNFNSPYLARSIADFWRRWHISFSRWLMDYVFKPLQLSWRNAKNWGSVFALLITFLFSGLWHGVGWGFILWGLLHGLFLAIQVFSGPLEKRMLKKYHLSESKGIKFLQIFFTFNLVCLAWVFFRTKQVSDGIYILSHLFSGIGSTIRMFVKGPGSVETLNYIKENLFMGQSLQNGILLLAMLVLIVIVSIIQKPIKNFFSEQFLAFVWKKRNRFSIQIVVLLMVALVLAIVVSASGTSPFFYTVF